MQISARHLFSPLAAVVTLVIGVAVVVGFDTLTTLSQKRTTQTTAAKPSEAVPIAQPDFFATTPPPVAQPPPRALSCYDMNILPIWHELKKDEEFKDRVGYSSDSPDCSAMLEIETVDLNSDGKREFLARGKDFPLCSPVGNCGFWIFEKKGSRFRKLFSSSDYVDISALGEQVLRTRTKGYADLLLRGHFSAAETGYYTYKFNGRRYVESRCRYKVPSYDGGGSPSSWEMITCDEFDRRNGF
jgi:hypothetical protein